MTLVLSQEKNLDKSLNNNLIRKFWGDCKIKSGIQVFNW